MKLVIDIPQAFVTHYEQDKFKESLERVLYDINMYKNNHMFTLSGLYEEETIAMLIEAFSNSKKAKSKKQMCTRAYNKGCADGVRYAEQNRQIRPNY